MRGIVTDIQRFSIHDGPGIRTTVFLKGCNLRCRWCHNPETLEARPQIQVHPNKCIGCGACLAACPRGAHVAANGSKRFLRDRCVACGACAAGCYADSLVLVGREMTAREVADEVARDRNYYRNSGGGVTVSGGEPLFQRAFTGEVLALCKGEGIHTAVETNLAWPWEHVESVLPVVDLVMLDVKAADAALHAEWTGADNARVLDNVRRLGGEAVDVIVRTPVVGGVNDTPEEIGRIADRIAEMPNLLYYELLPYHPLGTGKYESLGMTYRAGAAEPPSRQRMRLLAVEARRRGIAVRAPGEEGQR